jgi:hypothetical protein
LNQWFKATFGQAFPEKIKPKRIIGATAISLARN